MGADGEGGQQEFDPGRQLIRYFLGNMQRRGCTPESVTSCQRALKRFHRFMTGGATNETIRLAGITTDRLNAFVDQLPTRTSKYDRHPHRPPEQAKLSPFTIVKEIKILRGFGTWLEREGFASPFDDLAVPKLPRYVVEVLSTSEIEMLLASINPKTENGGRQYAIVMLMLDAGLRIGKVAEARLPNLSMERRQLKVIGKGQRERMIAGTASL